jgi:hypothetical protein
MDLLDELNEYAKDWRTRAGDVKPVLAAIEEIEALRKLASDAYTKWDADDEARVGKLLRAMVDHEFRKTYRPDLTHNAELSRAGSAPNETADV